MPAEPAISICNESDILVAREKARSLAKEMGFVGSDLTIIATAISEVARNIVDHAKEGEVLLSALHVGNRRGIMVLARDSGPGIVDIEKAMQYGYSTRQGLGVGLPGAKWLMDEFEIQSKVGKGTVIKMKKWVK